MLGLVLAAQKINRRHAQGWREPKDRGFKQTFCSLNGEEGTKCPAHGLPFSVGRGGNHCRCPETDISSPEGGCREAERKIRDFFFCSSCVHLLSLLSPFHFPCSRLDTEFDALFDRLVLCAETCKLCCNAKPFSITVSGRTSCLMLLFLFSFQKPL